MWHRALCRGILSLFVGMILGRAKEVGAFPLEKFDHQVEVSCAANSSCARSLRSKTTLGAYTGIWVRGGSDMSSRFSAKQGVLEVHVTGPSLGGIMLSWDSDTYAEQLSSAGLRCVDMRHQGAWAIVLKDFSVNGDCGGEGGDCPPFIIETRVYDSADPTGQTYSASVLRRSNGREVEDLLVPYSNFNRKGLRGEARMNCAGAVSLNVRADGYRDVTLRVGQIFTNSSDPLEALVFTPTPTSPPATPTPASERYEMISPTPTVVATISSIVSVSPTSEAPEGSASTEVATAKPELDKVIVAPLGTPEAEPERVPEEVVYGEIISE